MIRRVGARLGGLFFFSILTVFPIPSIFLIFATTNLMAQDQTCSLLTASEISAAVGTPGPAQPGEMPLPGGKGVTMKMCNWRFSSGGLHLSTVKAPQGGMREAGLAQTRDTFNKLKSQGWTVDEKTFGTISCVVMTPPAGKKDLPYSTDCFADAKGMGVGLGTISTKPTALDKMKTLIDQAIARL
jgi:hypothetical protein